MRSACLGLLACAWVASGCSKHEKAPPAPAASARPAVGRLPVDLRPGPFGIDCQLDTARASGLTRAHGHFEARKLAEPGALEIPGLRARLAFPMGVLDEPPEVRVTPSALQEIRASSAEWNHVYAVIAEDALPFDACIAHIGQESFTSPVTYTSLTIRIYALEEDLERVMREASAGAVAGAARIACEASPEAVVTARVAQPLDPTSDSVGVWKRFVVRLRLWYGDYGGTARVEIRAHRRPGVTVVLTAFFAEDEHRSHEMELEKLTTALE
jgi:hypothetical protein